ncbi:hypothetical protein [Achromobacter phage Motura]|uniref:Uncharacterized protein n=1 Tax=Achromobacter phage Motura TaxID=2591403 RepID=A0A514CSY4_9CAUD|nr:hypothetical protein H1O15_gp212 [Achromobacter phage Motura]QDH83576.1 hypothetical protein [Achromobacter phage Motura]
MNDELCNMFEADYMEAQDEIGNQADQSYWDHMFRRSDDDGQYEDYAIQWSYLLWLKGYNRSPELPDLE